MLSWYSNSLPTAVIMLNWKAPLAFIAAIVSACVASPTIPRLVTRAGTPNSAGFHDGVFYTWWSDGAGNATYTNGPGGSYSVNWTDSQGNFFGGKGWNSASNNRYVKALVSTNTRIPLITTHRVVNYDGTFEPKGTAYLSFYQWNQKTNDDYYVLESYGTFNPADYSPIKGRITCNGANYDVVDVWRIPIGLEPISYHYYSVRNPKLPNGHVSGTIDFACHLAGWTSLGLTHYRVSGQDVQLMATEGYFSSGFSNITVS